MGFDTQLVRVLNAGRSKPPSPQRVRECLEGGDDPNARDVYGQTMLYLAAMLDEPEILDILLRAGADPTRTTGDSGRSPLHVVAYRSRMQRDGMTKCVKCAELLLDHGADINLVSKGKTPLDEASAPACNCGEVCPRQSMIDFLKQRGGISATSHRL